MTVPMAAPLVFMDGLLGYVAMVMTPAAILG